MPERITARRAELDVLEEVLAKQLAEPRVERDELAVAERVLERMREQLASERASVVPAPGQVGGRDHIVRHNTRCPRAMRRMAEEAGRRGLTVSCEPIPATA